MVPIGKPLPRAPVVELGGGELLNCEWVGFCIHKEISREPAGFKAQPASKPQEDPLLVEEAHQG
jgi:hypothetical protein